MADRTWEKYEAPILEAVRAGEIAGRALNSDRLIEATGFQVEVLDQHLKALFDAGFVTGGDVRFRTDTGELRWQLLSVELTERSRRAIGQWPAEDAAVDLLRLVELRLANEDRIEERGKLERFRDAVTSLGGQVTRELVVAAAKAATGL